MSFQALPVPVPGSPTFNVDAQLFASGLAAFAVEANSIGSVIDLSLKSTSSTSLAIGTGSKTLTVQTGLGYVIGHPVRIASVANPSNFMDGIVTAYNSGTGSLTVDVLSVGGSGTIASWNTMVLPGGGNFASTSNNKFTGRQVFADEVTIASASTLDFTTGNSNQFVVTGTTGVTAVTMDQGALIVARFTGACQITNGGNLQLQGGANYTTIPGDILRFTSNGTTVRVEISKGDGSPVYLPLQNTTNDASLTSNAGNEGSSTQWVVAYLLQKYARQYTSFSVGSARVSSTIYTAGTTERDVLIGTNGTGTLQIEVGGNILHSNTLVAGMYNFTVPANTSYKVTSTQLSVWNER